MVYTQLNFHCLFSSAQSRLAKSFFFKKHKLCQKRKEYTQHHVLCKENLLLSLSLQQSFQYHWKTCYLLSRPISDDLSSRDQILKKSLSTFQPFTYVSNERYLINEMCIEGFSQRLELRIDQHWNGWMPKILPKKLWYSNDILIDQWLYECFSVISSPPDNGGSHLHFTQLLYILVHFYALASHCTYILSCWKIEAYNVLVKFTFALAGMEVFQTII